MENEFEILKNIVSNKNTTQRDLAKKTGMSLGAVNILIKRLIKKGLVKMDKLNPKTIRYILTPEGLKEKAELTYKYFVISYNFINEVNAKIDKIVNEGNLYDEVCIIFGENDEVFQLLQNNFKQKGVVYEFINTLEMLLDYLNTFDINGIQEKVIICWSNPFIIKIKEMNIKYIDLLEYK